MNALPDPHVARRNAIRLAEALTELDFATSGGGTREARRFDAGWRARAVERLFRRRLAKRIWGGPRWGISQTFAVRRDWPETETSAARLRDMAREFVPTPDARVAEAGALSVVTDPDGTTRRNGGRNARAIASRRPRAAPTPAASPPELDCVAKPDPVSGGDAVGAEVSISGFLGLDRG